MNRSIVFILCGVIILLLSGALPVSADADYPNIYKFYMKLGKLALEQGDYEEAYTNFRHARAVAPDEREPTFFINVVKRLRDGRVEPEPVRSVSKPVKKPRAQLIDEALEVQERRMQSPAPEKVQKPVGREPVAPGGMTQPKKIAPPLVKPERPAAKPRKAPAPREIPNTVYMDDALWATQPGTLLRVELRSSVILEGRNIKRHLIITPDFIRVETIDKDHIKIIGERRGSTFLHVWDDTGRWTFNTEVVLAARQPELRMDEQRDERQARPFRMTYLADWDSFYRGPTYRDVKRENLNFLQRILLDGETPYGDVDSHVIFNKFDESTEVTGYGIGLSDGRIGPFKDFSIRGYDLQKEFSPLTMPGQYVRGVLFEAKAFDRNVRYTYMRGRDRAIYGLLSPDVLSTRESYVEGGRLTLFPEQENQYSLNFARGWGDAREDYLKERVASVEGQHRFGDFLFTGEAAYDETATAYTFGTQYAKGDHSVTVNLRDLENDFTTVTGLPGNRGEVGGSIFWNWRLGEADLDTHLDLFRERYLPNPDEEDALNIDFGTRLDMPLSEADRLSTALYYIDTPGELSPRNNVRTNATYSKRLRLGGRDLTAFVGMTQQRSRFDQTSSSDYDRYSASTGLSVPVVRGLDYYANYEYAWVYEEQTGDHLRPSVFNTGLNFSKAIRRGWSARSSFGYRNEENTEGINSFLAGEDSITGSIGTTFRPSEDFELFLDGRTRNVWAEEADRAAYNEIDVRVGVRTSWDFPFSWNPGGTILGTVYKDLNGNQRRDEGEGGIPGVTVRLGKTAVVTDAQGFYKGAVRAKAVEVTLDMNTIPDGYIFSTPVVVDIDIIPHKIQSVYFGLTSQSGLYGIVYVDTNGSGKPDAGDEFVPKARMILDGERKAVSDFEGTYYFENVAPGRHAVEIDVNALPIEYLPKIKVKNIIETSEGSTYVFHVPLEKAGKQD